MTAAATIVRALLEAGEEDDLLAFDAKHDAVLMGYPDAAEVASELSQALDGWSCRVIRPFEEENYRRYANTLLLVTKPHTVSSVTRLHTEMLPDDIQRVQQTVRDVMSWHAYVYTPSVSVSSRNWRREPTEADVLITCVRRDYRALVPKEKLNSRNWYMHIRHPDVRFPEP